MRKKPDSPCFIWVRRQYRLYNGPTLPVNLLALFTLQRSLRHFFSGSTPRWPFTHSPNYPFIFGIFLLLFDACKSYFTSARVLLWNAFQLDPCEIGIYISKLAFNLRKMILYVFYGITVISVIKDSKKPTTITSLLICLQTHLHMNDHLNLATFSKQPLNFKTTRLRIGSTSHQIHRWPFELATVRTHNIAHLILIRQCSSYQPLGHKIATINWPGFIQTNDNLFPRCFIVEWPTGCAFGWISSDIISPGLCFARFHFGRDIRYIAWFSYIHMPHQWKLKTKSMSPHSLCENKRLARGFFPWSNWDIISHLRYLRVR